MRSASSSARRGTKPERVPLVGDPSTSTSADKIAPTIRVLFAVTSLLAVVATVGVSHPAVRGFITQGLGQSTDGDSLPDGVGVAGQSGMTTTTACDMKSTFCDLDLFIAEMFNCCVLSDDPSVQQDCLCDPVAYGMAPESTDNVGVDGEAALGVRRAGPSNLGISKSKLGAEEKYKSPGCRVDGYCDTPHDETDAMWAVCCQDEWRNVTAQAECLCNPMEYLI